MGVRKVKGEHVYRCVDKISKLQGKESNDLYSLGCTAAKITVGTSIGILVGIQALVVLFDVLLFFTCKEGIISHILKRRSKQRYMLMKSVAPPFKGRGRIDKMMAKKHKISSLDGGS